MTEGTAIKKLVQSKQRSLYGRDCHHDERVIHFWLPDWASNFSQIGCHKQIYCYFMENT